MVALKLGLVLFACLIIILSLLPQNSSVIVDGDKKDDISAKKIQRHQEEESAIDAYNVKTCGMSDKDNGEHEFVNMARNGEFPWIVSFQIEMTRTKSNTTSEIRREDLHFCAGSLISDKWILSAAHCFQTKYLRQGKIKVVGGSHMVSSHEPANRNLSIKNIFYHNRFSTEFPIGFDIALVELDDRVAFSQKRPKSKQDGPANPFFNTICLPRKDNKYEFNETARIAGWGLSNQKDATSMPTKLLMTDILLSKTEDCMSLYDKEMKSEKPRQHSKKYDDIICASYKTTRDACQSDSGGPLMQYVKDKAVIIGVVSYGIGCAKKGIPGLYTRTSAYINWIKDLTEHGTNSSAGFVHIGAKDDREMSQKDQANATIASTTTEGLTTLARQTTSKSISTNNGQIESPHLIPSYSSRPAMSGSSSRTSVREEKLQHPNTLSSLMAHTTPRLGNQDENHKDSEDDDGLFYDD